MKLVWLLTIWWMPLTLHLPQHLPIVCQRRVWSQDNVFCGIAGWLEVIVGDTTSPSGSTQAVTHVDEASVIAALMLADNLMHATNSHTTCHSSNEFGSAVLYTSKYAKKYYHDSILDQLIFS